MQEKVINGRSRVLEKEDELEHRAHQEGCL